MNDNTETNDNFRAIAHLKNALSEGREWIPALLESMSIWTLTEEIYGDHTHRYLLDGEAFDWMLLAERLLAEVDGLVPEDEKRDLLFSGDLSRSMSALEFKNTLGTQKYSAYLNYWYGVVVEEAVILCAKEEERKRLQSDGMGKSFDISTQAFLKIYGHSQRDLYLQFRKEKEYEESSHFSITEAKEFTYWLFKYRLINGEAERVASDTRKGILFLERTRKSSQEP